MQANPTTKTNDRRFAGRLRRRIGGIVQGMRRRLRRRRNST